MFLEPLHALSTLFCIRKRTNANNQFVNINLLDIPVCEEDVYISLPQSKIAAYSLRSVIAAYPGFFVIYLTGFLECMNKIVRLTFSFA